MAHKVTLGEEVVYHTEGRWVIAEVIGMSPDDELLLSCAIGAEVITQRATHGPHLFGWLTYEEAAHTIVGA